MPSNLLYSKYVWYRSLQQFDKKAKKLMYFCSLFLLRFMTALLFRLCRDLPLNFIFLPSLNRSFAFLGTGWLSSWDAWTGALELKNKIHDFNRYTSFCHSRNKYTTRASLWYLNTKRIGVLLDVQFTDFLSISRNKTNIIWDYTVYLA